jgi:uncharacterized membrane protein YgcG
LYRRAVDAVPKCLLSGNVISLQDAESLTYLSLDGCVPGVTQKAKVVTSIQKSSSTGSIFDSNVGTKMLWVVEHDDLCSGGPVSYQLSNFTLRNLNSGLFIRYDSEEGLLAVSTRTDATRFQTSTQSTEFGVVYEDQPLQLSCNGLYLSTQASAAAGRNMVAGASPQGIVSAPVSTAASVANSPRSDDQPHMSTKQDLFASTKSNTGSFDVSNIIAQGVQTNTRLAPSTSDKNSASNFLVASSTMRTVGVDLFVGVQATRYLRDFEILARQMKGNPENVVAVTVGIKSIFAVLDMILAFLTKDQRTFGGDDVDVLIEPHSLEILATRQILAREQGLLDVLLDLIELCGLRAFDKVKKKTEKHRGLLQSVDQKSMRGNIGSMKFPTKQSPSTSIVSVGSVRGKTKTAMTVNTANNTLVDDKNGRGTHVASHRKAVTGEDGVGQHGDDSGSEDEDRYPTHDDNTTSRGRSPTNKVQFEDSTHKTSLPPTIDDSAQTNHAKRSQGGIRASFSMGINMLKRNSISGFLGLAGSTGANLTTGINLVNVGKRGAGNKEDNSSESAAAKTAAALQAHQQSLHTTMSQELGQACFRVLLTIIRHNHANQIHVAGRFPVLLKQVRNQEMAVACVHELLNDNPVILQTKIRDVEIKSFVLLLVEFEMNVTFMKLLQNACSCPMGVDSTQRAIAKLMFGKSGSHGEAGGSGSSSSSSSSASASTTSSDDDGEEHEYNTNAVDKSRRPVVLSFCCEFLDHALTKIEWNTDNSIYLPSDKSLWTHVFGNKLLTDGYPRVFVKWKNMYDEDSEFSMLSLFNTNSMVSLQEICHPRKGREDKTILVGNFANSLNYAGNTLRRMSGLNADLKKKRNSKLVRTTVVIKRMKASLNLIKGESSNYDKKCQLRDYLISQLYLMADLCLDRNYVAMSILEILLEYETLMSILLANNLQNQVKAAACRIIRCMYVDRDPQVVVIYPKLVKSSHVGQDATTVGASVTVPLTRTLSHADDFGHLRFSLLQQVISEYIRYPLNEAAWDELSAEMMSLLGSLIGFGFYDPNCKLQDVLFPVIEAADLHRKKHTLAALEKHSKVGSKGPNLGSAPFMNDITSAAPTVISNAMLEDRYEEEDDLEDDSYHASGRKGSHGIDHSHPKTGEDEIDGFEGNMEAPFVQHNSSVSGVLNAGFDFWTVGRSLLPSFIVKRQNSSQNYDDEEYDGDSVVEELSWQESWHNFSNQQSYSVAILLTVCATIVAVIFPLIKILRENSNQNNHLITAGLYFNIDISIAVFFSVELLLRWYCFYYARGGGGSGSTGSRGNVWRFYRDWYNVLDAFLAVADILILAFEADFTASGDDDYHSHSHHAVTVITDLACFKMIRCLRLFRLLQTLRILCLRSSNGTAYAPGIMYSRTLSKKYSMISEQEVKTMIGMLRVISLLYDRIQDQNVTVLVQSYEKWFQLYMMDSEGYGVSSHIKTPIQMYSEEKSHHMAHSAVDIVPATLDHILLDNIMFADSTLVQESLNLLMVHKSKEYQMLQTASKLQLLHSLQESKYKEMSAIMKEIKSKVEKFEIWGELYNPREVAQGTKLKELLETLVGFLLSPSDIYTFSIMEDFSVDVELQQLLVNLNAFPVMVSLQETLLEGGRVQPKPLILDILRGSNNLLCWIIKGNKSIQGYAYTYMHWFVDRIDSVIDIGSSTVAQTILEGNSELILNCPKKYVADMVAKIIKQGFHPCFLDLLVGMVHQTKLQDMRVVSIEREISRFFTGTEWKNQLLLWSITSDPSAYRNRAAELEQNAPLSADSKSVVTDDMLSANLRYYSRSLVLLACCNLGPKLQALFPVEDVLGLLIAPSTVFPVRKELGELFLEMLTNGIPLIEYYELSWRMLDSFRIQLTSFGEKHADLFADPAQTSAQRRQMGEWLEIMLKIVIVFFTEFDFDGYQVEAVDANTSDIAFRMTSRSKDDIAELVLKLFAEIKANLIHNQQRLGRRIRSVCKSALEVLYLHSSNCTSLTAITAAAAPGNTGSGLIQMSLVDIPRDHVNPRVHRHHVKKMDLSGIVDKNHRRYRAMYQQYIARISGSSESFKYGIADMVALLETIPLLTDLRDDIKKDVKDIKSDLREGFSVGSRRESSDDSGNDIENDAGNDSGFEFRLEHFLRKLSYHIRIQMKKLSMIGRGGGGGGGSSPSSGIGGGISAGSGGSSGTGTGRSHHENQKQNVETFVWLLRCLRGLLENYAGVVVACNGDLPLHVHTVTTRENRAQGNSLLLLRQFQDIYNNAGVTFMCLDLITAGTPKVLMVEAFRLLSIQLWRHGGNATTTGSLFKYLKESDSVLFFEEMDSVIVELMHWIVRDVDIQRGGGKETNAGLNSLLHNSMGVSEKDSSSLVASQAMMNNSAASDSLGESGNFDNTGILYSADYSQEEISGYQRAGAHGDMVDVDAATTSSLPAEFAVFTVIRLMCEGDSIFIKDILRDQTQNSRSANIFESMVLLVDCISKQKPSPMLTRAAVRVLQAVLKLIRGPCFGNQERFVLHTELIVSFNRFIRQSKPNRWTAAMENISSEKEREIKYWCDDIDFLRELVIDILLASTEGRSTDSVVFERVATTIELNVFTAQLLPASDDEDSNSLALEETLLLYENMEELPVYSQKYLVLLKYLRGQQNIDAAVTSINTPATTTAANVDSLNLSEFTEHYLKEIVSVAIQTSPGNVETVYFMKPEIIARYIPFSKVKSLTADIESMTQDLQLKEFLVNCRSLYRQAKHQQLLSRYYYGLLHNNLLHVMITLRWIMFFNAVLLNILIMEFYEAVDIKVIGATDDHDASTSVHRILSEGLSYMYESMMTALSSSTPATDDDESLHGSTDLFTSQLFIAVGPALVISGFTVVQIFFASVTAFIYSLVTTPVLYKSQRENGKSVYESISYACQDYTTVWYFLYLVFAVLGLVENRLFLSALLLDLANLDATTMYLLMAVRNPAKQLIATLIMVAILMYIFSGLIFQFFLHDIQTIEIHSLWECFKLGLIQGTRGEYGVSTQMDNTLGHRLVVDVFYYFIILAVMREVFFAIIIDTFGQLTDNSYKRTAYANNTCFICGIQRQDFESMGSGGIGSGHGRKPTNNNVRGGGFLEHRETAHNSAHYFYFLVRIWENSEEDDSGFELIVRRCLQLNDISWFPLGMISADGGHHRHAHRAGLGLLPLRSSLFASAPTTAVAATAANHLTSAAVTPRALGDNIVGGGLGGGAVGVVLSRADSNEPTSSAVDRDVIHERVGPSPSIVQEQAYSKLISNISNISKGLEQLTAISSGKASLLSSEKTVSVKTSGLSRKGHVSDKAGVLSTLSSKGLPNNTDTTKNAQLGTIKDGRSSPFVSNPSKSTASPSPLLTKRRTIAVDPNDAFFGNTKLSALESTSDDDDESTRLDSARRYSDTKAASVGEKDTTKASPTTSEDDNGVSNFSEVDAGSFLRPSIIQGSRAEDIDAVISAIVATETEELRVNGEAIAKLEQQVLAASTLLSKIVEKLDVIERKRSQQQVCDVDLVQTSDRQGNLTSTSLTQLTGSQELLGGESSLTVSAEIYASSLKLLVMRTCPSM